MTSRSRRRACQAVALRCALALAGLFVILCCTAKHAIAQPLVNEVYEDAKDIITELIERDVAESIAPNLACYSQNGLLKYFPGTLQAVYDRNFGGLKAVLQKEAVALAGNYAFECFRQRRTIPLKDFLPIASFTPVNKNVGCAEDIRKAGGPASYQEQEHLRVIASGAQYLPLDACTQQAGPAPGLELPCFLAQATVAAANGDTASAEAFLSGAVATTVTTFIQRSANAKLDLGAAAQLRKVVIDDVHARFTTGAFSADGLFGAFAGEDFEQVWTLSTQTLDQICSGPPNLRVRAGGLWLLLHPQAFTATIRDHVRTTTVRGELLLQTLQDFQRDSAAALPGEGLGGALARALFAQASQVPVGRVTVTSDTTPGAEGVSLAYDEQAKDATTFTGPGLDRLVLLREMAEQSVKYRRILLLAVPSNDQPTVQLFLHGFFGLAQALERLGTALHGLGTDGNGEFQVPLLFNGIVQGKLKQVLCNDQPPPYFPAGTPAMELTPCVLWTQFIGLLDPQGTLLPMLNAAREKNYRALATSAVAAVFSETSMEEMCCGVEDTESCRDLTKLYGRLAKSVVSYVLMPRDDQDASMAARAAFKSAAVDVIRSLDVKGGVEVEPTWASIFTPSGAMRASWSGSYQNEDSRHTGLRFVPTIDFLTFRKRLTHQESPLYFGAQLTLFDLLAPFTEIVSRESDLKLENKSLVLATLIEPRLSGVIAIPELTKHTVLTLGASIRGSAAFDVTPVDANGVRGQPTFRYATLLYPGPGRDFLDGLGQLLEVSAGVQYIP